MTKPKPKYKTTELRFLKDIAPSSQTTCLCCNEKITKGKKRINFPHGSYNGKLTYGRFHLECFLKSMLYNYPELYRLAEDKQFMKECFVERVFSEEEDD